MNFKTKSDKQLLELYGSIMSVLRERGLLRTANNPAADYAEYLVARKLGLYLAHNCNACYDAESKTHVKYQIKSRRITSVNSSKQLGVIRNLETANFHYLIAVIFDEFFNVLDVYQIPKKIISKYARYSEHQHGHILTLRGKILEDKDVKLLSASFN